MAEAFFVLNGIRDTIKRQQNMAADFFGLRFWNTHTIFQGYAEATDIIIEDVGAYLKGRSTLAQSVAGSAMGLLKLFGAIPIGLATWELDIMRAVPKGVPYVIRSIVETPVIGFVNGGIFVYESVRGWTDGNLDQKSPYQIAYDVTTVLGSMVFILKGSESCIKGGGKFLDGFKFVPDIAGEVATARLAFDAAVLGGAARNIWRGTAFFAMQSANPASRGGKGRKVPDSEIANALCRTNGNRTQASRLLKSKGFGIADSGIGRRIRRADQGSELGKYKEVKGWPGGEREIVPDGEIFSALREAGGNRRRAAQILEQRGKKITSQTINTHIRNSGDNNPLAAYKSGRKRIGISHDEMARVLDKNGGDRTKAAAELGIKRRTLGGLIVGAKKGSPLLRFKGDKGCGPPKRIGDNQLAAVLEKTRGSRKDAAMELRGTKNEVGATAISVRIKRAKKDSPLFKFKEVKGKRLSSGSRKKVSDLELAQALEKTRGHRTWAADTLKPEGKKLSRGTIMKRIAASDRDSPLARFRKIKGNANSTERRVSDDVLVRELEASGGNRKNTGILLKEMGLGINARTIGKRIKGAKEGSPLEKFKQIKGASRRPKKIGDEALAAFLKSQDGNRSAAAREIAESGITISPCAICKRIERAGLKSPLARFQKGREEAPKRRVIDIWLELDKSKLPR